jgi:hypothetical protein
MLSNLCSEFDTMEIKYVLNFIYDALKFMMLVMLKDQQG